MSNLKPIGSEKLTGQNKINRIMEIARFNESAPKTINENETSEYSISLADGNNYQIVRDRQGYIIKKTISESETDYIEPMRNRKYYSSYSQAFKRLNLVAGELNRLNENEEGVSLYGEQKRFTLKTPKPAAPEMPAGPPAELPAAPPSVPAPELPPSPMDGGEDMGMEDMGMEDAPEVDDVEDIDIDTEEGGNEDQVTFKTIQKLTGKLGQKLRVLNSNEEDEMSSKDIKYVINSILSALDLENLDEEDKEEITKNEINLDKELMLMLINQNKELLEIVKNGTNNHSHNTTNSHNKAFNLNFFLNETCKNAMNITDFVDSIKLQLSDLMNVGELGYVEGISNIIVKNLNNLDETERPIHCTDKKRETFYVKDQGQWEKEDEDKKKIKKIIKTIEDKNIRLLPQFREKYPDYNNSYSKTSDKYDKIVIEAMSSDKDKEEKIIKNISSVTTINKN